MDPGCPHKLTFVLKAKNIGTSFFDVSFLKSGWLDQNISRGFFKLLEAMTLYLHHKESWKSTWVPTKMSHYLWLELHKKDSKLGSSARVFGKEVCWCRCKVGIRVEWRVKIEFSEPGVGTRERSPGVFSNARDAWVWLSSQKRQHG